MTRLTHPGGPVGNRRSDGMHVLFGMGIAIVERKAFQQCKKMYALRSIGDRDRS
jgi:hypothetical protein